MEDTSTEDKTYYHCRTEPEVETFSYTWTIVNFWQIYEYMNGLESSDIKNYTLYMKIMENDVTFYIRTATKRKIIASYSVSLETTDGKELWVSKSKCPLFDNQRVEEMLFEMNISNILLNKAKYCIDNALTMYFSLHYICDVSHYTFSYFYRLDENFTSNMDISIPNKSSKSLVTITVNNKSFDVDKFSLCSKSRVFKDIFRANTNKTEINDITHDVMEQLLFFVKTGYLSKQLKVDIKTISQLFITADTYEISNLKSICEHYLIRNVTTENAVKLLKLAFSNDGRDLKDYAKKFIQLHLNDVIYTSTFCNKKYPELILDSLALLCSSKAMYD